jgi:rod shape-determining protein MreD
MIRRYILSFALVSLLVIIQSTWLDIISIYGVIPDISLILIVYISFKNSGIQGQTVGFATGLLQDSISAAPLGLNAFLKTSIALLANLLSGKFYIDRLLMPAIFGFMATLIKAIYLKVLSLFFVDHIIVYQLFDKILWIESFYNALISPIIFFALKPLDKYLVQPGNKS